MAADTERSRSIALLELLIEDVIAARGRLAEADSQTARRDIVRASFAAMEGMVWMVRDHVRETLADLDHLSTIADLAMREQTYVITDSGRLVTQSRSVPMPAAIRFIILQARLISPEIAVEFGVRGWADLRRAMMTRNRITHPKPDSDLAVSDEDLEQVASGLSWLSATVNYVMASTNLALVRYNDEFRDMLQRLSAGDPEALIEYHSALRGINNNDH